MPQTKTPRELFSEACGLQSVLMVPRNTAQLLRMLSEFCQRHRLEWGLEDGSDALFCVFIFYERSEIDNWIIDMEGNNVNDCIIQAVAVAWSNIFAARQQQSVVVDINEWRQK